MTINFIRTHTARTQEKAEKEDDDGGGGGDGGAGRSCHFVISRSYAV